MVHKKQTFLGGTDTHIYIKNWEPLLVLCKKSLKKFLTHFLKQFKKYPLTLLSYSWRIIMWKLKVYMWWFYKHISCKMIATIG